MTAVRVTVNLPVVTPASVAEGSVARIVTVGRSLSVMVTVAALMAPTM